MKIFLLGATGNIGRRILRLALHRAHDSPCLEAGASLPLTAFGHAASGGELLARLVATTQQARTADTI